MLVSFFGVRYAYGEVLAVRTRLWGPSCDGVSGLTNIADPREPREPHRSARSALTPIWSRFSIPSLRLARARCRRGGRELCVYASA